MASKQKDKMKGLDLKGSRLRNFFRRGDGKN